MSKHSFKRWCREKLGDLRLRKVVEDEESETDSWVLMSNQVLKKEADSRKSLKQLLRLRYDTRNSERYPARRDQSAPNSMRLNSSEINKAARPNLNNSSDNAIAFKLKSMEQAIICMRKAIIQEKNCESSQNSKR